MKDRCPHCVAVMIARQDADDDSAERYACGTAIFVDERCNRNIQQSDRCKRRVEQQNKPVGVWADGFDPGDHPEKFFFS